MYRKFYGLQDKPFTLIPDPRYLYPSRLKSLQTEDELKNGIVNVYSQFNAFYKKITGWDGKSSPVLSTRTHPIKIVDG